MADVINKPFGEVKTAIERLDPGEGFTVVIRNRAGVIFSEEVTAITSNNEKGIFDILPEHASFISLIKDFINIRKKDGNKQELKIDSGVVKVFSNVVKIYVGVGIAPAENKMGKAK